MLPLDRQNRYRERFRLERPNWRSSGDQFEALARQRLGPGSRVLDLGCGRGGVMELLWREVHSAVGADPDLASLYEHRAGGQGRTLRSAPTQTVPTQVAPKEAAPVEAERGGLPLVCTKGEALPFRAGCFDVVIALWVLEHLPQPEVVLQSIWRVLAPGGRFLFLTPNANHPLLMANCFSWAFPAVQKLLVPKLYGRSEADTFRVRYQANTPARLRQLASANGFTITAQRTISDPTYLAFNEPGYRLSVWLESWLPSSRYVHIMGDWVKTT